MRPSASNSPAFAREKGPRLPKDHPRAQALVEGNAPPHRLKGKSSWRIEATKNTANLYLPLDHLPREPLPNPFIQPWRTDVTTCTWRTLPYLPEETTPTTETLAETVIRAIDNLQADIVIYTDGSRKAGIENGGAAAVVTQGNASNPIILETLKEKGRALTSLYEEEKAALKLAMKWIVVKPQPSIAICSDSHSLLKAIECM